MLKRGVVENFSLCLKNHPPQLKLCHETSYWVWSIGCVYETSLQYLRSPYCIWSYNIAFVNSDWLFIVKISKTITGFLHEGKVQKWINCLYQYIHQSRTQSNALGTRLYIYFVCVPNTYNQHWWNWLIIISLIEFCL